MKVSELFSEGNPFDFAAPVIKFNKLDDLPKKPHSIKDVQAAMKVLYKMVHAQAHAYGGKHGKLLPVGIAEAKATEAEEKRRQELYATWKKLINMSPSALETFKKSQTEKARGDASKYPGMKPAAAKKLGISSGVQSADWIIKMKRTPVKDWTPEMWRWAGKQVSFVSRMLGNSGPLYDENGEPTRKLLSLKIWGHNPR